MESYNYRITTIDDYILISYNNEKIKDDWVIVSHKDLYYINLESILDKSIEFDIYCIL